MKVVVLGASGTVGSALLPLLGEHHDVVAVARRPGANPARWVTADVTQPEEVRAAVDGADVVFHLVHSLGARDYGERDRRAADAVARAAAEAGVRQIVYLGGLGDGESSPSAHLRSRAETARRLADGGVPVTTLRAAMIVGRGSAGFETIRALVDRLPGMVCPKWVSTETQPVALRDVARYLAGVAGRADALGEAFDVGGPEVMTYRSMIERIARLRGRRARIVEVPVLSPRLSSLWLHLVTPVEAGVARPLVEGLRSRTVARDDRIRGLVPFPPTSFDEAAREALERT